MQQHSKVRLRASHSLLFIRRKHPKTDKRAAQGNQKVHLRAPLALSPLVWSSRLSSLLFGLLLTSDTGYLGYLSGHSGYGAGERWAVAGGLPWLVILVAAAVAAEDAASASHNLTHDPLQCRVWNAFYLCAGAGPGARDWGWGCVGVHMMCMHAFSKWFPKNFYWEKRRNEKENANASDSSNSARDRDRQRWRERQMDSQGWHRAALETLLTSSNCQLEVRSVLFYALSLIFSMPFVAGRCFIAHL